VEARFVRVQSGSFWISLLFLGLLVFVYRSCITVKEKNQCEH